MGLEGRFKFQSFEEKRWVLRADLNDAMEEVSP